MVRTSKTDTLSNLQIYETKILTVVTMLYITFITYYILYVTVFHSIYYCILQYIIYIVYYCILTEYNLLEICTFWLSSPIPYLILPPRHHITSSVFSVSISLVWTSQVVLVAKNLPANAGDVRDLGWVPGLGTCPVGGHSDPLQYCCLENPLDRGAWGTIVHRVSKSWTRLKWLNTHAHKLSLV